MAEDLKENAEDLVEKLSEKTPDSAANKVDDVTPGDNDGDGH
jgi:hypothetical protein